MCMFCAAVPVAGAVGANLNARQKATRQAAQTAGKELPAEKPVAKITLGVIVLLTVASVLYHTIITPIWKV